MELTGPEIERIEAKLYGGIPNVTPDDAIRLINDWRKHRWAIITLIRMFRPSLDGRFYSVNEMRKDTFDKIKKAVGL